MLNIPKSKLISVKTVSDTVIDEVVNDSTEYVPLSVESPWNSGTFPKTSILWPSPELEAARSAPVDDSSRLAELWSLSNSHGISWDELDEAFLEFHREYIAKEAEWIANYDSLWDKEYAESERVLRRSLVNMTDSEKTLVMSRRRGKIRRMTYTRISRIRFSQILKPFHMRQFIDKMRALVSNKVIQRETSERQSLK